MSGGAFRDASAAIERAAVLEEENRALHEELVKLRVEVEALRNALDEAGIKAVPDADLAELRGERDILLREVRGVDNVRSRLAAVHDEKSSLLYERNEMTRRLEVATNDLEQARGKIEDLRMELARAHRETEQARADAELPAVPPNRDAYTQRVQDERDELLREVRELRDAQARAPKPSFLAGLFRRR